MTKTEPTYCEVFTRAGVLTGKILSRINGKAIVEVCNRKLNATFITAEAREVTEISHSQFQRNI